MASAAAGSSGDAIPVVEIDNIFSPYLIHQLDVIKEQAESGLYVLKRAAAFLKKISSTTKQNAQGTVKSCQHELAKERARKDGMNLHVQSYLRIQDSILKQANAEVEFSDAVVIDVVDPMNNFFKDAEKRRLELVAKHQKLNHKLDTVTQNVTKTRAACMKAWKELQAAEVARFKEAQKNPKKLPKMEKTFRTLQQKTVKTFQSFEQLLATAISDQKRHWEVELPELIEEFERLEVARMSVMKTHLSIYAQLQTQLRGPLDLCIETAFEVTEALAPRQELAEFVREQVQVYQLPPRVVPFKVLLPCSSAEMEAGGDEFHTALNQDPELAAQTRQELLDSQERVSIELPVPRQHEVSGVKLPMAPGFGPSASSVSSSSSSSAAHPAASSSAASGSSSVSSSGTKGSAAEDGGSDSDEAVERKKKKKEKKEKKKKASRDRSASSASGSGSKKEKKDKSGRLRAGTTVASRADSDDSDEMRSPSRSRNAGSVSASAVSEDDAEEVSSAQQQQQHQQHQQQDSKEAVAEEDEDAEDGQVFDLKAALKEDKKAAPLWLVVANFDFQPGERRRSAGPGEDEEEGESDNEDLAVGKGDWLRVTHRQQHDSDEEDSEDEDEGPKSADDLWWRGFHCRLHGASERGIFPSNYVSETTIAADNPSLHVWLQRPSAVFAFAWAQAKLAAPHVAQFVALWSDIELFRKLECRHLRDAEEEIDHSNLLLQGHKIVSEFLRPIAEGRSRWQLKTAGGVVSEVSEHGDEAIRPRMFDACAKEMAQLLSKGFEVVRKRHPEILGQLSTVYAKAAAKPS